MRGPPKLISLLSPPLGRDWDWLGHLSPHGWRARNFQSCKLYQTQVCRSGELFELSEKYCELVLLEKEFEGAACLILPRVHTETSEMWCSRSTLCQNNLKTQFYSALVRPTIHTNPSRKQSFWKRSLNRRKLKTPAFCFVCIDEKNELEKKSFRKRWRHKTQTLNTTEVNSD